MAIRAARAWSLRPKRPGDLRIYAIAAAVAALALPACAVLFWVAEQGKNPDVATVTDAFEWLLRTLVEQESKVDIVTAGGHVAYLVVVFSGLTLVGTGTGAIASHLVRAANERRTGIVKETSRSEHFIVCGWNSRGMDVLRELISDGNQGSSGREVVVIASLPKKPFIDEADLETVEYVQGDPRSKEALRRAGVERAKGVIVLAEDQGLADHTGRSSADAITLLTALVVKAVTAAAGKSTYITAEVLSGDTTSHFLDNAINYVTHGEILPALLARDVTQEQIFGVVKEMVSVAGNDLYVDPAPATLIGMSFGDAVTHLKLHHDVILLGIRGDSSANKPALNPPKSVAIAGGDRLIYLGQDPVRWETV